MEIRQELLVEGNDDLHVVYALCQHFNIKENFKVIDSKGIDRLFESLPIRLKGSSTTMTIGAVIDADANAGSRWKTIRNILVNSGKYSNIPEECPADGLILHPTIADDVKFGVWIMPDNRTEGMLEDFTSLLIPPNDDLLPIVDQTLSTLEANGKNRYSITHHEKARIHTWLAWQETPGIPMGLAITKKYLSIETPVCQSFVNWLNCLFE